MRVTDPRAIRALAHPLRLDLIELLGGISPATAARCAEILGVSHASASYHLRQLAKYGFVEESEPTSDQRERPWRVISRSQEIAADHHPAADELTRVTVERETTKILDYVDRRGAEVPAWRDASFHSGSTVPLTADELADLRQQLSALIEPYLARVRDGVDLALPPGGRWVRLFLAGTPYPELDLAELRSPTPTAINHRTDHDNGSDPAHL